MKDKASLLRLVNTLDKVQQMINQVVTRDNTWVGRLKIFLSRIKHFGFCTPREKLANLAAQYNHSLASLNIQSLDEAAKKEVMQLLDKTQVLLGSIERSFRYVNWNRTFIGNKAFIVRINASYVSNSTQSPSLQECRVDKAQRVHQNGFFLFPILSLFTAIS